MKKEYRKIRWFSFTAFAVLLAVFGLIYALICVNLVGDGVFSAEGEGVGAAVGTVAAGFFNLMSGVVGMIAAPIAGVLALIFGIRASSSRVGAIRWISRILSIAVIVALAVLVVLFFGLKQ